MHPETDHRITVIQFLRFIYVTRLGEIISILYTDRKRFKDDVRMSRMNKVYLALYKCVSSSFSLYL